MDNSRARLHDVFFYGLYMDPAILEQQDIPIRYPRKATVPGYTLRIGNKATLLRDPDGEAHGMVYLLNHDEIHRLYAGAGLDMYRAEAVLATTEAGPVAALCCNLLEPPGEDESNKEYSDKLHAVLEKLGLPVPGVD